MAGSGSLPGHRSVTGGGPLSGFDCRGRAGCRMRGVFKPTPTVTRAIVGAVITESAELAVSLVLQDFAGTAATTSATQLVDFDPAHLELVADLLPDPSSWVDHADPDAHRLFFMAAGGITSLDHVPDATGALAVEMASILQDVVIDDLFRPWPQVAVGGRSVVLEPRVGADGAAEWAEHGNVLPGRHSPRAPLETHSST